MSDAPRVLRPNRAQLELRPTDLESLLPEDHRARVVWEWVTGLDLSAFYDEIGSVEGQAGRPAIDPAILLSLWLYATLEGVGSARAIERLCEAHDAYRWICGGVPVSHRTLSLFRVGHEERLEKLLTESVVRLIEAGLVEMKRVTQDGMRVRASAGAASFRRRKRLRELRGEVAKELKALRRELDADPAASTRREQAARERAAKERQRRVREALKELEQVEEKKKADEKEKARASTTDPEARVMKMADGGFRPAYNVQFASDSEAAVIVGVEVTNAGHDAAQLMPMRERLERRYGRAPEEMLVDGGYATREAIEQAEAAGCRIYAPPMQPKDPGRNPFRPLPGDSPAIARWRRRMGTESGKTKYRKRCEGECLNAQARNHGLRQFLVRGLPRTRCVALLYALAINWMQTQVLYRRAAEAA
jgi:transposase